MGEVGGFVREMKKEEDEEEEEEKARHTNRGAEQTNNKPQAVRPSGRMIRTLFHVWSPSGITRDRFDTKHRQTS